MIIRGNVLINGEPAQIGTTITVKIEGNVVDEFNLFEEGTYFVSIDDGKGGDIIKIFVNGIKATEVEYGLEVVDKIDLNVQDNRSLYSILGLGVVILVVGALLLFTIRKYIKRSKNSQLNNENV
jgi:hypothetical protein